MQTEKFDVVVVGAGPAGSTAALVAARAGLNVALLERGEYPGAKNMFGGMVYRWPLEEIVPNFWERAPIERYVTDYRIMMLSKDSGFTTSYRNLSYGRSPYNTFTVLRAKFDRWYAAQAEAAGALLVPSATVTDVIRRNGRIVGVKAGGGSEDEVYADVVIAADGVTSIIAQQANLRPPLEPKSVALGVKEILELPPDVIDSRFRVEPSQGVSLVALGVTKECMGGGFIYTNKDTLSVGIVVLLEDLMKQGIEPHEMLDEFENHPLIEPLLRDGKRKEYSAHMIPEGGFNYIPKLYCDGLMVAGDAAFTCDVLFFEGTNMAAYSGMLAAKVAVEAKKQGDFSERQLSRYARLMESSYVIRELKQRRNVPRFLSSTPRLWKDYPDLLNLAIGEILAADGVEKREKRKRLVRRLRKQVGYRSLAKDLWGARSLIP